MADDLTIRLRSDNSQPKAVRQEEIQGYKLMAREADAAMKAGADAGRKAAEEQEKLARALQVVQDKLKDATDPARLRTLGSAVDELTRRWQSAGKAAESYRRSAEAGPERGPSRMDAMALGIRARRQGFAEGNAEFLANRSIFAGATFGEGAAPGRGGAAGIRQSSSALREMESAAGRANYRLLVMANLLDDLQYVPEMGLRPILNQLSLINPHLAVFGILAAQAVRHWDTLGPAVERFVAATPGLSRMVPLVRDIGKYLGEIPGAFEEFTTGNDRGTAAGRAKAKAAAQAQAEADAQAVAGVGDAAADRRGRAVAEALGRSGGAGKFVREWVDREQAANPVAFQAAGGGAGNSFFATVDPAKVEAERRRRMATVAGAIRGNPADIKALQGAFPGLKLGADAFTAAAEDPESAQREAEQRAEAARLSQAMRSREGGRAFLRGEFGSGQVEHEVSRAGAGAELGRFVHESLAKARDELLRETALKHGTDAEGAEAILKKQADDSEREDAAKAARDAAAEKLADLRERQAAARQFRPQLLSTGSYLDSLATAVSDPLRKQIELLQGQLKKQDEIIRAVEKGQVPRFQ